MIIISQKSRLKIRERSDYLFKKHEEKKPNDAAKYKSKYDRMIHSKWGSIFLFGCFILMYLFVGSYMAMAFGSVLASFLIDLLLACFAYWYLHTRQNKFTLTWGYESKLSLIEFTVLCILAGLVIFTVCQLSGATASLAFGDPNMKLNAKLMRLNPGLTVIMSLIIAPIAEEMVFRGVVYNTLKCAYLPIVATILQALAFAGLHGTWAQGTGAFLLGLFNVLIYEYSGRLRYSIYSHMAYNVFAIFFAMIRWPVAIFKLWIMGPIYFLVLVSLLYGYCKVTKLKPKKEAPNDPLKQILGIK